MITFPHGIASFARKGNNDTGSSSRLGLHETQLGPIVLIFGSYGRVSGTGQTASYIHLGHRVSPQSSRVMPLLSIGESSNFAYGDHARMYTVTCSIDIDKWSRSSLGATAGYPPHVANHFKAYSL